MRIKLSEGQGFDPPRRQVFAIGTVFFHLVFGFDNVWNELFVRSW